jgi:hypothetical protein
LLASTCRDARITAKQIDGAYGVFGILDNASHIVLLSDVCRHGDTPQFCRGFFRRVGVDVYANDGFSALRNKLFHQGFTDTAAGACNNDYFVLDLHLECSTV